MAFVFAFAFESSETFAFAFTCVYKHLITSLAISERVAGLSPGKTVVITMNEGQVKITKDDTVIAVPNKMCYHVAYAFLIKVSAIWWATWQS